MRTQPCKPHPLAASNGCDLWVCADCGTINLNIGPVSMRLKPEHFEDVAVTMQNALQTLVHLRNGHSVITQYDGKINHQH